MDDRQRAATVLGVIRSRRVTREFADLPVADDDLRAILEAGRWATSGGNRRIHRFLVVRDPAALTRLRAAAPGILGRPRAVIAVCTDASRAAEALVQLDHDTTTLIDVGTAAMTMMIAAHALALGSCPVTSFSEEAVRAALGLPHDVRPDLLLALGHPLVPRRPVEPADVPAPARPLPPGLVWWERPGQAEPTPLDPASHRDR